jgi:CRISPR-associated endoribonuclease Cas6
MKSVILSLKKIDRVPIPFEYNYFFGIAIYNKLRLYQENIKNLHNKNMQDVHTFSSVISRDLTLSTAGIDFNKGTIILRSLDDKIIEYLRIGLSLDNILYIGNSKIVINSIKKLDSPDFSKGEVNFKSISPALIRNFSNKNNFVIKDDVSENLSKSIAWSYEKYYASKIKPPVIEKYFSKVKTVKISNNGVILNAVLLKGKITGDEEVIKFSYFKGFGSKTGLGLGCWEVDEDGY